MLDKTKGKQGGLKMYKCYSDAIGSMPCDNGCMCDKCMYELVEIISCEIEEEEG